MTAEEFRQLALAFPGAVESSHMDHPDFRVGGKVFATLGYPEEGWGMVKLTPEDQRSFIKNARLSKKLHARLIHVTELGAGRARPT